MKQFSESVRRALQQGNYYAALSLALTLPDLAGWAQTGRQGRQRYIDWWNEHQASEYFALGIEHETALNGADCYALRCAFLHQGTDDTTKQRAREVVELFDFVVPTPGMIAHCNPRTEDGKQVLQLDVRIFARDLANAFDKWLDEVSEPEVRSRINATMTIKENYKPTNPLESMPSPLSIWPDPRPADQPSLSTDPTAASKGPHDPDDAGEA